jgi:hypothetical protein
MLLCTLVTVDAQQPPPGPAGGPPATRLGRARQAPDDSADPGSLPEAQLAAMLDTYAIVQAQGQLGIPDEKYGAFAARLKKLQDVRRRNLRLRRQIIQELRKLAGPRFVTQGVAPDEAAIRKQLAALRDLDERSAVELRQTYDSLDELLNPSQQARFRIFEEQIEKRKLDLLFRAQERARANKNPS